MIAYAIKSFLMLHVLACYANQYGLVGDSLLLAFRSEPIGGVE